MAPKKKGVVYDEVLSDPEAERARLKAIQEKAEMKIIDATFMDGAGTTAVEDELFADDAVDDENVEVRIKYEDLFDDVQIKTSIELEKFAKDTFDKLNEPTVPKGGTHKFIFELIKEIAPKCTLKECEAFQKTLMSILKTKRTAATQKAAHSKAADITKKHAKIDAYAEMNMMYGAADEEEWEEEEWKEEKAA